MTTTQQLGQFPVTRARTDLNEALAADVKPRGLVMFTFSDDGLVFDWYGAIEATDLEVCTTLLQTAHERMVSVDRCTHSGFADEPHGGPTCGEPGAHQQICPLCQAAIIRCETHGGQLSAARALAKHLLQAHPEPANSTEPGSKKAKR